MHTSGGEIAAGTVVVATHFPMLNKHGSYFMKLYQHRSYVLALQGAPHMPGMYVDENKKGFRISAGTQSEPLDFLWQPVSISGG